MTVAQVNADIVQTIINTKSKSLCKKTITKIIELMRQIFDAALEDEIIKKSFQEPEAECTWAS